LRGVERQLDSARSHPHIRLEKFMDLAEAFILDAGWVFIAAWGLVLTAVSVIAFARDIPGFKPRQSGSKNRT
jgi:hypothetical protein